MAQFAEMNAEEQALAGAIVDAITDSVKAGMPMSRALDLARTTLSILTDELGRLEIRAAIAKATPPSDAA